MNLDMAHYIYSFIAIVVGFTIHEYSHALVALKLGDTTAKDEGRITFNPIKHIDPMGMILILVAGFGWAKPVRFNSENLGNPKRDRMLIAVAGPLSNLVLGLISLTVIKTFVIFNISGGEILYNTLFYLAAVNLGLFMFNMLPFPPLDGSHLVLASMELDPLLEKKIVKYGAYALLAVIILQSRTSLTILPIGAFIDFVVGLFF